MFSDLLAKGYRTVPQMADGRPPVGYINWTHSDDDVANWDNRYSDANIGLVCGINGVAAIDIDCNNATVNAGLEKFMRRRWPTLPIRRCNPPRFAVLIKVSEDLAKIGNGRSNVFGLDGDKAKPIQVELIGYNKLITLYGEHRKTGNIYSWDSPKCSPYNVPVHELPVLNLDDIKEIFEVFNHLAEQAPRFELVAKQRLLPIVGVLSEEEEAEFGSDSGTERAFSDAEAVRWLSQMDLSNRENWLKAGFAMHKQFNGSVEGLELWDKYSQNFDGYEEGCCADAWPSMNSSGPVGIESVAKEVKAEIKKKYDDKLVEFTDNLVYINVGQQVADTRDSSAEALLTLADFRVKMAGVKLKSLNNKGEPVFKPATQMWLESPDRVDAHGTTFIPNKERLVTMSDNSRRKQYWNTYIHPEHTLLDEHQIDMNKVRIMTNHIARIFNGEEGDAEWILDWLADMLQRPEVRPTVTPLHINTTTRTGRGWITNFIELMVGKENTGSVELNVINNPGAKNGYMAGTLAVFSHEVREKGKDKYALSDKLKSLLTEKRMDVDVKYGEQGQRNVYARFFLMSNHKDPLVINDDDARINVFNSSAGRMPPAYFQKLYSMLDDPGFAASCYSWLMYRKYDTSGMNIVRYNKAREALISSSRSLVAKAFFSMRDIIGNRPFTIQMLEGYVEDYIQDYGVGGQRQDISTSNELPFLVEENTNSGIVNNLPHGTIRGLHWFGDEPPADTSSLEEAKQLLNRM